MSEPDELTEQLKQAEANLTALREAILQAAKEAHESHLQAEAAAKAAHESNERLP